jgi:Fur family ferric uptake transcriptional regulator
VLLGRCAGCSIAAKKPLPRRRMHHV